MAASLLDRGRERGYQHRLTMFRSGAHNRGVLLPTRAAVPLPTRFHRPARVLLNEAGFPAELGSMPQPVRELWYVGRLPRPGERRLAIVGARGASLAGCRLAREAASTSAHNGLTIVSGGALGIDAAAHRGALDAESATFAVFGCWVDVVYPDHHDALFADI